MARRILAGLVLGFATFCGGLVAGVAWIVAVVLVGLALI